MGLLYVRALLGTHVSKLRAAMRDGDRGASAVELAIITAVLVAVAIIVLTVIHTFVNDQSKNISQNANFTAGG
jgi:Flp pilus assembly pilin Flp